MNCSPQQTRQSSLAQMPNIDYSKVQNALNFYRADVSSLLRKCMLSAGFNATETQECDPTYLNFMACAIVAETQCYVRLVSCLPKISADMLPQLNFADSFDHIVDDPQMIQATNFFQIDSSCLLKRCMLAVGFPSSETQESDPVYLYFMAQAITVEYQRYQRLIESQPLFRARKSNNLAFKRSKSDALRDTKSLKSDSIDESSCVVSRTSETFDERNNAFNSTDKEFTRIVKLSSEIIEKASMISETKNAAIYCVSYMNGKAAVKVLKNQTAKSSEKLLNEYKITREVSHPGIRRAIASTLFKEKQALLLEWFDGKTLQNIGKLHIKRFLTIAREIVSALVALHNNGIMHKNINTENIMVDLGTATVKIIGSSMCARFYEKNCSVGNPERLQGDLHFISPEQTGSMNRIVDFRSDFYSLGIVFYYMLTADLPYASDNPSQLMHMHIFEDIPKLNRVDRSIPLPICDMVAKLMAKNAEDRYQAAKGLLFDLDMMVSEYDNDIALTSILLAQRDFTEKFLVSQKLYDRSSEFSALLSAFERVSQGSFEVTLVKGNSGTGKSCLVSELYKPVTKRKGRFVNGKYDQSHLKTRPYSGLLEALQNFCDLLLTESTTILSRYKIIIQQAVGEEGKILTDWITNLHLIIGEQKKLAHAVGQEAKNRFNFVLCNFIRAICSKLHPLVLFLDDLQWMDQDSRNLLSMLISDKTIQYLLVVGAYRNEEVNATHPLAATFNEMKEKDVIINQIEVRNLSKNSVNKLISEALHTPQLETLPLTALVLEKTQGNAFFVIQVLRSLSDEKLLYFSYEHNKWLWDLNKFDTSSIADSVLELMKDKILKLNKTTQDILKAASCIGNLFSISTLSLLTDDVHAIEQAITEGMIVPSCSKTKQHKFAHDQIQNAASVLIPDEDRKATHFRIGKLLWEKCLSKGKHENLFVVVNLLNSAREIITDSQERIKIAKLNLEACKMAKSSTAFKLAMDYVTSGINFLGSNHWLSHYDLSLQLHNVAAEVAYCYKDFEYMEKIILQIWQNASCMLHKVYSYSIQIKAYNDKRMHEEAVNTALYVLDKLGVELPSHPTDAWIKQEVYKVMAMKVVNTQNVAAMRIMEDETIHASMQILSDISMSCYFSKPSFFPVVALQMVKLTFVHGISQHSACSFALFGVTLYNKMNNLQDGYRFCQLSLLLLDKFPAKDFVPRIYTLIYGFCLHWSTPIQCTLKPLLCSYKIGLEVGTNDMALISAGLYLLYAIHCGKPLWQLLEDVTMFDKRFDVKSMAFLCLHQTILTFTDDGSKSTEFLKWDKIDTSLFDDEKKPPGERARGLPISYIVAYYFHDYEQAARWADQYRLLSRYSGKNVFPVYMIYDGMIATSMARQSEDKRKWKVIAEEALSNIRKWAVECPKNFEHNVKLLEAELASLNGNATETIQLYDEAITLAKLYEFLNIEALACERAGIFCINHCKSKAAHFLSRSYQAYSQWGAIAKMRHLMLLFPEFIVQSGVPVTSSSTPVNIISSVSSIATVSELSGVSNMSICDDEESAENV